MDHYLSSQGIESYIKTLRQRGLSSNEILNKLQEVLNFALWLTKRGLLNPGKLTEVELSIKKFELTQKTERQIAEDNTSQKKGLNAFLKRNTAFFQGLLRNPLTNKSVSSQDFPVQAFTGLILVVVF